MTNEQLIKSMIPVLLAKRLYLSFGETAAHESDEYTYKFLRYAGDVAEVMSVDGSIFTFPADEVFNPNVLMKMCLDHKFKHLEPAD